MGRSKSSTRRASGPPSALLAIAAGIGLLLLALAIVVMTPTPARPNTANIASPAAPGTPAVTAPAVPITVKGAPSLQVDRAQIDFGAVTLGHTVDALFILANTGDQPLTFSEAPYIEVIAGC